MDNRAEVRDFLTSRRERLTPERAGMPSYGDRRRVKGLRREEVAMLAGMSTDYYTRLERGNLTGVSEAVLESLARALQFDEAERAHLFDLAGAASPSGRARGQAADASRRSSARTNVREGVRRILDSQGAPAYVANGRMDVLATNRLGRALFTDAYGDTSSGFNLARYLFLDPRSRDFYLEWDTVARDSVASLRAYAGRNPYDRGLTDLVGELTTRSEEFAGWWATHAVKFHRTSTKKIHHSVVGDLEVTGEALELPGDPGLRIVVYTVEPASPSEQALAFLASWSSRAPSEHEESTRRQ
ncbi:helix-turn-helix transcriptional regulator [Blastococcus sp. CCUG 61487]|uniref:helix-turn-helix transcriptional regulator n=1 Tax=Blastococcus sp. CCUG 61487 TaxID=1840703 RepID=UPI0010C0183C|nr:helix-turn-helix transcriptional regulator [Blastococcus sp. CCUG 61487]TKJ20619.1 transcriptional regulator [Blastococcus sp. CCUG 61487]